MFVCDKHSAILLTVNASPLIRLFSSKLFNSYTNHNKFHNLVDQNINLKISFKSPQGK